jgi:dihydroanticapsin dehydrogenase
MTSQTMVGRRAIVTGGASGIGLAVATLLLEAGSEVVIADVNPAGASAAERLSAEHDDRARFVAADVADEAAARDLVHASVEFMGGVDGLVNVAGIQRSGEIADMKAADWDEQMRVNVRSCFLMCREVVVEMRRVGRGSIVTTASGAGVEAAPGMTGYSASKGAIVAFTRSLGVELAPEGIRCNCVAPGWTNTAFNAPVIDYLGGVEAHRELIESSVPLRRQGEPSEIAEVVLFLLSDASSYLTAQTICVDGGSTA